MEGELNGLRMEWTEKGMCAGRIARWGTHSWSYVSEVLRIT